MVVTRYLVDTHVPRAIFAFNDGDREFVLAQGRDPLSTRELHKMKSP